MMNQRTSFLTRFLALALAVVLAASGFGPAVATRVSADEIGGGVNVGTVIANNYDLTDEEEDLLYSGYLTDSTIACNALEGEGLVTVDAENGKITAKDYEGWTPVDATIIDADGNAVETVDFDGTVATFDPAVGGAFSVEVYYELNAVVDADLQASLLNAPAALKQGVANMDAVKATDVNLAVVAEAMDTLVMLADGIKMGPITILQFQDEAAAAVKALAAEIEANYGILDLQAQNALYDAAAAKTEFLAESGLNYNVVTVETYNALKAIAEDRLTGATTVDNYLAEKDPANHKLWMALKEILNATVAALEPAAYEWTIPAVSAEADFAELDALVAAVEETTTVEVNDTLTLDWDWVSVNQGMYTVTYTVEMMVADADGELSPYGYETVYLNLVEGATAAEIMAAIEAQGDHWVLNDEAYAAEHYDVTTTELPAALTEDTAYTVTYSPKYYTVTTSYADAVKLPYGAVVTLPVSEDAANAYDYTVNGKAYAEGAEVLVDGDLNITRTSGKAYFVTDLFTVIADNYGNAIADAILKSGALEGNETISVRKPEPADAKALLNLANGTLTAEAVYASDYLGLSWVPYAYGSDDNWNLFNGSATAEWNAADAKVQYVLTLSNIGADKVNEILGMVKTLKSQAAEQAAALDRLVNYYADMGALNKIMLGGMLGSVAVTDFYTDAAKNAEMRTYFTNLINTILGGNMDGNNLSIYKMLTSYQDANEGGLRYYYANAEAVINEIKSLSQSLNGLVGDKDKEDSLALLLNAFGYSHYVEKIANLGQVMAEVGAALTVPNAAIDLNSENLGKLLTALAADGNVEAEEVAAPYLLSDKLNVTDVSRKLVEATVVINGQSATFATPSVGYGEAVTAEMISALKAQVAAQAEAVLGAKAPYYTVTTNGDLDALVGQTLTTNVLVTYTYAPVEYTVNVEGSAAQTVTVEDLEISLPKHAEHPNFKNVYTINGTQISSSVYTFAVADLDTLFADGAYTVACTVVNAADEKLEAVIGNMNNNTSVNDYILAKNEKGEPVSFTANIAGNSNGLMNFATDLASQLGMEFSYVGLNGEPLMYLNEKNELEVSLQTLINALLNDKEFCNQTLIDLGENGKGTVFTATLQLGDDASAENQYKWDHDVAFILNMKSVPAQMATVAKVLNVTKNFVNFYADAGKLNVELNLPEEVYAAYLAVLIAHGDLDKTNMNAINTQIAFEFMFDWYETILNSDMTTTTFQNTLEMIDGQVTNYTPWDIPDYDLTQYEAHYQKVLNFLRGDNVVIEKNPEDVSLTLTAKGESIVTAVEMLGFDLSAYNTQMNMIAELKEGRELTATAVGSLINANTDYEAVVIDVRADGSNKVTTLLNKFDMTENLAARVEQLAGAAAISLIDDVNGDLTFNAMTVIDLNGHTINGNIKANAKVIILDSVIDNADNCGGVNGNIEGNVTILAGKYTDDVTANILDGYVQNANGAVHNALYSITNNNGVVTVEINSDYRANTEGYLPDVRAMAVNIAFDLVTNFFHNAALTIDGNEVYNLTFNDILGLLDSDATPTAVINALLNVGKAEGIENVINTIIADLIDFGAIEDALRNGDVVASYTLQNAGWTFDINHVTENGADYLSGGIAANYAVTDEITVELKFNQTNETETLADLAGYLDSIVLDETYAKVDLVQPYYVNKTLNMAAGAEALISLDLADDCHLALIAHALAYGNPEKAPALMAGLEEGDASLKAAIDSITVADICTSLKAAIDAGSYAAIVEKLGVSLPVNADIMEKLYNGFAAVATKGLNVLEAYRGDCLIGSLDADNDGIYELTVSKSANVDVTSQGIWNALEALNNKYGVTDKVANKYESLEGAIDFVGDKAEALANRGYTAVADVEATVTVKVNLFCRWGDVNHDGKVNAKDATLILQEYADVPYTSYFCELRSDVNGDGKYNAKDATLILQYYAGIIDKFPVEE